MRCLYCHNPDTWGTIGGKLMRVSEILEGVLRNHSFYTTGGITATGGEPLMQLDFLIELFTKAHALGIHTCLDTSGILYSSEDDRYDDLLRVTDLVLLDIKHMDPAAHRHLTGHDNAAPLAFARRLSEEDIPIWIRHVVVPGITDDTASLTAVGAFIRTLSSVKKLEVLPYHSMGAVKYESLGIPYALSDTPQVSHDEAKRAEEIIRRAASC